MVKEIYSIYSHPSSEGIIFDEEGFGRSMAQQHFKEESDINNLMARYNRTGTFYDPLAVSSDRKPQFGDYSSSFDFHAAQNLVADAYERFDALPSDIRKRFDNDPSELLSFIEDENNHDEAVKLGLIEASSVSKEEIVEKPHQVTIEEALKQSEPASDQPPKT